MHRGPCGHPYLLFWSLVSRTICFSGRKDVLSWSLRTSERRFLNTLISEEGKVHMKTRNSFRTTERLKTSRAPGQDSAGGRGNPADMPPCLGQSLLHTCPLIYYEYECRRGEIWDGLELGFIFSLCSFVFSSCCRVGWAVRWAAFSNRWMAEDDSLSVVVHSRPLERGCWRWFP